MLNFAPEKMLIVFFIVMLVLGPERLPELARRIGRATAELRRMSGGFQEELRRTMDEHGVSDLREIKQELTETVRQATTLPTGDPTPPPVADPGDGPG